MAKRPDHTTGPVVLNGFQSVLRPSEYGYCIAVDITDPAFIEALEARRAELLPAQIERLKNKKRAVEKPTPWEENEDGTAWNVKLTWDDASKPPIVDSVGTLITDTALKLYSGSTVRLAFDQNGYTLKDGLTYGTCLKIKGIRVIECGGVGPKLTAEDLSSVFGDEDEGGFVVGDIPDAAGDDEDNEEGHGPTADF